MGLEKQLMKPRSKEKSKITTLFCINYILSCVLYNSIERDAQLLANRIALLKQEEMKTWKKIEETKKRATEVKWGFIHHYVTICTGVDSKHESGCETGDWLRRTRDGMLSRACRR